MICPVCYNSDDESCYNFNVCYSFDDLFCLLQLWWPVLSVTTLMTSPVTTLMTSHVCYSFGDMSCLLQLWWPVLSVTALTTVSVCYSFDDGLLQRWRPFRSVATMVDRCAVPRNCASSVRSRKNCLETHTLSLPLLPREWFICLFQ